MTQSPQNRREFLRAAVRNALLAAVGGIGFVLYRRGKNCASRSCTSCSVYAGCALPWREAKR